MPQELLVTDVYDAEESRQRAAAVLANAQVHATLAVASVLGLSADLGAVDMQTWRDVAATRSKAAQCRGAANAGCAAVVTGGNASRDAGYRPARAGARPLGG